MQRSKYDKVKYPQSKSLYAVTVRSGANQYKLYVVNYRQEKYCSKLGEVNTFGPIESVSICDM